jgi:hypothetical protein
MPQIGYAKDVYLNNCAWIGPNHWYEAGDTRFHPDNIITDIRALNCSFIISHATGDIVWKLGPYYDTSPALEQIGLIIGQHQVHMIPAGLPGAGNILIFDNGGEAGYGNPNPNALDGRFDGRRGYSRVLEIDPVTLDLVWDYGNYQSELERRTSRFFSQICSGMQRLPNGNTLICETTSARVFEVTPERDIVWEYVDPGGFTFRAHRYPYDWVPQVGKPTERPVRLPKNAQISPEGLSYRDEDEFYNHTPEFPQFPTAPGRPWPPALTPARQAMTGGTSAYYNRCPQLVWRAPRIYNIPWMPHERRPHTGLGGQRCSVPSVSMRIGKDAASARNVEHRSPPHVPHAGS